MSIGNKAQSLQVLQKQGFTVPKFIVCDSTVTEQELSLILDHKLKKVQYFAVRSSVVGEDGASESMAGHFHSSIAVERKDVFVELQRVVASYGNKHGSVIVQEFIPSECAGVVFTNNGSGYVLVNANFGLCSYVVAGEVCDEFVLDQAGNTVSTQIAAHKTALHFRDGDCVEQHHEEAAVAKKLLQELVRVGKAIEQVCGCPQDIEWCFYDGQLYILQSRAITRSVPVREEIYFDSANIAESYSGIVLPLTFSFAKRLYRTVYMDFLHHSGVPWSQLTEHQYVFDNLLDSFHGRMYYNMNNWYRMAQFVPGYRRNKQNFESMITSTLRHEIPVTITPKRYLWYCYPVIVLLKISVFWFTTYRFKRFVQTQITRLRNITIETASLSDCVEHLAFLEGRMLRRWYVTLENDFFVMTYLGLLQTLYPDDNLSEILVFKSKATEQVSHLQRLAKQFQSDESLWSTITENDRVGFLKALSEKPALQQEYEYYFQLFGGRFANELKLETVGLDEDIQKFFTVLKHYVHYKKTSTGSPSTTHTHSLSWLKRMLFSITLQKFKKYSAQREECRLLRSNMFSITRSLFKRIGALYVEEGLILDRDDIFYLTVDEVLKQRVSSKDGMHKETIAARKQQYDQYGDENPLSHFVLRDGSMESVGESGEGVQVAQGVSAGVVTGTVRVMKEFSMPEVIDFDILVARHTDPGWTALIALSKGLIIERGGVLSHASIVARELGVPAVIGVKNATTEFVDGQLVELNGSTGVIRSL